MNKENNKGYRLELTNLDSGEKAIDVIVDCIIGGYSIKDSKATAVLSVTACNGITILATIEGAKKAQSCTLRQIFGE